MGSTILMLKMQTGDSRVDQDQDWDPDFCEIGDPNCTSCQKLRTSERSSCYTKSECELINKHTVSSWKNNAESETKGLSLEMASSLTKLFAFIDEQTAPTLPETTEKKTDCLSLEIPSSIGELFAAIDGWMSPINIAESTSNTNH